MCIAPNSMASPRRMADTSLTGSRRTQMKKKIFYGWWIVAVTNIICLIGYWTWLYCFGVFFKPMMKEFGWTRTMTAGAYSLRGFEGGFISPLVGWAVDKYGPRGSSSWEGLFPDWVSW